MTPVMLWQLVIFAAYAFGFRPALWFLGWIGVTLILRIGLMVWSAIVQVRAEDAKQATRKKSG